MKPVISPRAMSSTRPTGRSGAAIVELFLQYLETNRYTPLSLKTLCTDLGVAERTLRAACAMQLGTSPIRYLNEQRMQLVRRALLKADPSRATVTQIATDHEFSELGHFSIAYRKLFGEKPSTTLRERLDDLAFGPTKSAVRPHVEAH